MRQRWRMLPVLLSLALFAAAHPVVAAETVIGHGFTADGYAHIVLEMPHSLLSDMELEGKHLVVRFLRPVRGRFDAIPEAVPDYVQRAEMSDDNRSIVFDLTRRLRLYTTALRGSVLIDLYPVEPEHRSQDATAGSTPVGGRPGMSRNEVRIRTRPMPPRHNPAPPVKLVNSDPVTSAEAQPAAVVVPIPPAPGKDVQTAGATPRAGKPRSDRFISAPEKGVPVRYAADGKGFSLTFDWPVPVAAAVFRRNGILWMVFDRATPLNLGPARAAGGSATTSLEPVSLPLATGARLSIASGMRPAVQREGDAWIVTVRPGLATPVHGIPVVAQPRAPGEPRLFLPVADATDPVPVDDPATGESVQAVPVRSAGTGIGSDHVFPQLQLLASAQGIAVRARSDGIRVRRVRGGVQVTAAGGLLLSDPDARSGKGDVRWPGDKEAKPRLLRIAAWQRADTNFTESRQKLEQAVATASKSEIGRRRLELAQFFFANGFAADALGVLELIRKDEPIAREPAFKALVGAAALMTGNLKLAEANLMDPGLDGQGEVSLWRGALRARSGGWNAAARYFGHAEGLLRFYPDPYRSKFLLLAARASLETGDAGRATRYLDLLDSARPDQAQKSEAGYLRGRALRMSGEADAAVAVWDKVIRNGRGAGRVEAKLGRIEVLTKQGAMKPEQAIDRLEQLRFAWRGDDIERAVLLRLADLYLEQKHYERGLATLRRAIAYFPGNPENDALRRRMRDVYAALFFDGKAKRLSAVKAVTIFKEFYNLLPADSRGDAMIRSLVDRLVSVDLLDQAAKLLRNQVEHRLAGKEHARIGARLAAIWLLDEKPENAIRALDDSGQGTPLPELAAERARLRARALADLGETGKALVAIAGDDGPKAQLLRAEINWDARNWTSAAISYGQLAQKIRPSGKGLSDRDSRLVLSWAAALVLAGDKAGLVQLRRRFDLTMEKGPYASAYDVIADQVGDTVQDFPALLEKVREVDQYARFMDTYRDTLEKPAAQTSAVN